MNSPAAVLGFTAFRAVKGLSWLVGLCLAVFGASFRGLAADAHPDTHVPIVIHEWGTFTSLQNDRGEAIGGINSDDEPVPRFVHRLAHLLLLGTQVPPTVSQGAPHCHPDVTMRLETPVIYFHPPAGSSLVEGFDVSATFKGGWLSEYYPNAETETNQNVFGPLGSNTVSTLVWKDLHLGGEATVPQTLDHVWTSPREVNAALVRASGGEAEKCLFYRGVGHLNAPLAILSTPKPGGIVLRSQVAPELAESPGLQLKSLWLVHIRSDGKVAYRGIPPVTLGTTGTTGRNLAKVSTEFAPQDYSLVNRDSLKASLQTALVGEGLFADEAQALLNTWELSYFKSSGWRVFFMVPRAWTEFYLPLKVSIPAEITRVMVGRIELISAEEKEALRQLASFSESQIKGDAQKLHAAMYSPSALHSPENRAVFEGKKPLDVLGISIPKSYAVYLGLGRFRDALLLDEQKHHPSKSLDLFMQHNGVFAHKPRK
jgi:hypothetical protein